jgi:ATP-dependent RNA helicase DeaD
MNFSNLPPFLGEALADRGYSEPTPVQAAVLEDKVHGRDLIVSAQTGSGKTVAFGLAMAAELLGDAPSLPRADAPMTLVIAPTRELALQVSRELVWLYGKAGGRQLASAGWMPRRSGARSNRARISWSALRAACAITWSGARSTSRHSR